MTNLNPSENIIQASLGFDYVFSNDLEGAKQHLSSHDSPFHLMGLGCVVFLQAALGMEACLMVEATSLLTQAEIKAKKEAKAQKNRNNSQMRRFPPGLDFEVLQADAILLLGITQALTESYTGYIQCMCSCGSAHTKFTRIYNVVFPDGIEAFASLSSTPVQSRQASMNDVSLLTPSTPSSTSTVPSGNRSGFFGRWIPASSKPVSPAPVSTLLPADGPVEELIIAGAAFGYGLFNLILSLLPVKIRGVVGFFGYKSDRRLALHALAVAATKDDAHAVFAGLTLMSYHGAVLLSSGYQADEEHIMKLYKSIVEKFTRKYPAGSLCILNAAKILRISSDLDGAIAVLRAGLAPDRPHSFAQADALLIFELAWTLLSQRKYEESAEMFMKMTEVNSWSHATFYFIAAGCHSAVGNNTLAQSLLDSIPELLEKRKLAGRDLPSEVFIRKKVAFYKQKQTRRCGSDSDFAECIKISPAEGNQNIIVWNMHHRLPLAAAEDRIREWTALSYADVVKENFPIPKSTAFNEKITSILYDIDTPDELALRSLLLGVVHRSISHFPEARGFLLEVATYNVEFKWMKGLALFELAVVRLQEAEAAEKAEAPALLSVAPTKQSKALWQSALKDAEELLDRALEATGNADMSSRIESRISMLRDEISFKRKLALGD
ncbi:outer membrane protein Iml2/Tetratricopeptide repeat protein 39 [Hysterangium stoloniferum]|nr:outer membrane protein Iml2/Tetratricopeptide repeat protein 39 [Hysterangium stoloniferum]